MLVSFYGSTSLVSWVILCSDCVMRLSGFAGFQGMGSE